MFCKRLNEITAGRQIGLVPSLLGEYAEIISNGSLRAAMDGIPVRSALQLRAVLEVVDRHLGMTDASHVRFRECVQDFLCGIRYETDSSSLGRCAPFFEDAYARHYQPFMQQRPYVLENYLVNHVFRTRFPYGVDPQGKPNRPLTEYWVMCVLFAVIKGLLIGMAGHYREEFGEVHVIRLVQSFAKSAEHSPNFLGPSDLSLANADGMALLLKN